MEIKPSLHGLDLCLLNSLRLFEDSCTEGLSLPTVGAILEIGLEEVAKGFLILICFGKKERISPKVSISSDEYLNEFKDRIGKFVDNINCQEQLPSAFRKHEAKTEILNFIGSFINLFSPESPLVKDLTIDFLRSYDPSVKNDFLEKQYSYSSVINSLNREINARGNVLKKISWKIKELGFYVDWTGSGFKYPEINNSTIRGMADLLFEFIVGFKNFSDLLQIKLQTELDVPYLYQKLSALKGRLK